MPGERDDDTAVAILGDELHPGVAHLRGADELVEGDLVRLGDREQQLEARLALSGLETGEGALGDAGLLRQLRERHSPLVPHATQPWSDVGQNRGQGRRGCPWGKYNTGSQNQQQTVAGFEKSGDAVRGGDPHGPTEP